MQYLTDRVCTADLTATLNERTADHWILHDILSLARWPGDEDDYFLVVFKRWEEQ